MVTMRLSPKRLLFLFMWILPALCAITAAWQRRWMSDDGFINLRIVTHFLQGHGPVFNVSERVEAGTSTLWLGVLALLGMCGLRVEDAAIFAGCALLGLGVAAGVRGCIWMLGGPERARQRWAVPCGAMVFVALPPVWDYGTSGLEFGLSAAWIGVMWWWAARATDGVARQKLEWTSHAVYVGAFIIGLGPLVRPDLAMVSFVFGMAWLVLTWSFWRRAWLRRLVSIGASAMALPLCYQIFRMGYYAALTPNTAFAKEAFESRWEQGLHYVDHLLNPYALGWPLGLCVVLGVWCALRQWRTRRDVALLCVAALVSAVWQVIYVVKVGGGFMHARLLLPAVCLALLPVMALPLRVWVGGDSPTHRASVRPGMMLALLACLVWCVVCASSWRVARENAHGIGDERGWYARLAMTPNPYRIEHFERFASTHFYKGAAKIRTKIDKSCPDEEQPGCARLLINDVAFGALPGNPGSVPMKQGMYPDVRGVAARLPIGMSGFLLGTDVHLVDRAGLADAISSRMMLRRRGRPGHEKQLGDAWFYARFSEPREGEHPNIKAARAALECGTLAELQHMISAPLTGTQFMQNISFALSTRHFRVPPEPELARLTLCHPKGLRLTPMLGTMGGRYAFLMCPDASTLAGLDMALNHDAQTLSFLTPACVDSSGKALKTQSFGKKPKDDGAIFANRCERGEHIRALEGFGLSFVHALGVRCRDEEQVKMQGYTLGELDVVACGPKERAVGLQVKSGSLIDAVGLICEQTGD